MAKSMFDVCFDALRNAQLDDDAKMAKIKSFLESTQNRREILDNRGVDTDTLRRRDATPGNIRPDE